MFHRRVSKLQPRTLALIERVFAVQWFGHVGEPLAPHVYAVKTWSDAVEFAKDPDEVFLEVRNDYSARLHRTALKRFRLWNQIVQLTKNSVVARVDEMVELHASPDAQGRKLIRDHARWSILHACLESEYLDDVPAGFFLPLADWYAAGRFPAGWYGKYPQGMLAVF